MNLLSKKINVNDKFQISVNRLIYISLIMLFQFLGMWCLNGWILTPAMFFLVATWLATIEKKGEEEEMINEVKLMLDNFKVEFKKEVKDEIKKELQEDDYQNIEM